VEERKLLINCEVLPGSYKNISLNIPITARLAIIMDRLKKFELHHVSVIA